MNIEHRLKEGNVTIFNKRRRELSSRKTASKLKQHTHDIFKIVFVELDRLETKISKIIICFVFQCNAFFFFKNLNIH